MGKDERDFSGYLTIDEETLAYSIHDHFVTLLPACSDHQRQYEAKEKLLSRCKPLSEFLFGNDGRSEIAFYHRNPFPKDLLSFSPIVHFSTPLIVKATGFTD